jgi:hypothetical protein
MFQCIIRDKGMCQKCHINLIGAENNERSTRVEFHHIKPVSMGGEDSVSNLITLCHECHMGEHGFDPNARISRTPRGPGYSVVGNKQQGHRITIPISTGVKVGDKYTFIRGEDLTDADFPLPPGTLVYIPVSRPTSKREKKGVSG